MDHLSVQEISVTKGDTKGEINIHWDALENADLYMVQYCEFRRNLNWKIADITNEPKYTMTGLKSNRSYCFRVAAMNTLKQGSWTKPVIKKI